MLGSWFGTIALFLQIPFCKMPELVVPAFGFSGLLPKFVSADANLFVCRVRHLTESWKKRNSSAEPWSHSTKTIRQFDDADSKKPYELFGSFYSAQLLTKSLRCGPTIFWSIACLRQSRRACAMHSCI